MVSQSNLGRLIIGRLLIYTDPILIFSSMKTVSHRGPQNREK